MKTLYHLFALPLVVTLLLGGCAAVSPVKTNETSPEAAYQAYREGKYELAAERFARLVEQIPKDAELWFRLGNAEARAKNPKKAIAAYENALLRDPQLKKAWYNLGLIHLQEALKTFTDMENYVAADDPVGEKGRRLRAGVFSLLEGSGTGDEN